MEEINSETASVINNSPLINTNNGSKEQCPKLNLELYFIFNNFEIRNPAIEMDIAIKVLRASNNNEMELPNIEAKKPVIAIIIEP